MPFSKQLHPLLTQWSLGESTPVYIGSGEKELGAEWVAAYRSAMLDASKHLDSVQRPADEEGGHVYDIAKGYIESFFAENGMANKMEKAFEEGAHKLCVSSRVLHTMLEHVAAASTDTAIQDALLKCKEGLPVPKSQQAGAAR